MPLKRSSDGKLAIERIDDLLLSSFADSPWTDASWREYCEAAVALSMPRVTAAITFSPKQGPGIGQRKMFVDDYGARLGLGELRYAILLSDSMLVRGTFTATSWLVTHRAQVKAYKPRDIRAALDFVRKGARFDLAAALASLDRLLVATGWDSYRQALR